MVLEAFLPMTTRKPTYAIDNLVHFGGDLEIAKALINKFSESPFSSDDNCAWEGFYDAAVTNQLDDRLSLLSLLLECSHRPNVPESVLDTVAMVRDARAARLLIPHMSEGWRANLGHHLTVAASYNATDLGRLYVDLGATREERIECLNFSVALCNEEFVKMLLQPRPDPRDTIKPASRYFLVAAKLNFTAGLPLLFSKTYSIDTLVSALQWALHHGNLDAVSYLKKHWPGRYMHQKIAIELKGMPYAQGRWWSTFFRDFPDK